MSAQTIFNFKETQNSDNWKVVDDVVMGGRSLGNFEVDQEGYGIFYGAISLENNGGFSSVRYKMPTLQVKPENQIQIKLKGDGSTYQFRIKVKTRDYHSYITKFETTGDWETLEFTLSDLYPTFRGRNLDMPNFDKNTIEEIRFLIGNKKEQKFKLKIESIQIK